MLDILKELESDNSRLFKESVLNREVDNELFKRVCKMTYDPFTNYYIRKIPEYTPCTGGCVDLEYALDTLESMFATRKVTGNAAIQALANLLSTLSEDVAEVIKRVLQGDLKCGVSAKTINKTWKGLIFEYPCMLAQPDKAKTREKIKFPALAQIKADGMRINAFVRTSDGTVEYRSRNGKEVIFKNDSLENELLDIAQRLCLGDVVIDGEMLCANGMEYLDRKTSNGICNKAIKGTISDKEAELLRIHVWDYVPLEQFKKGIYKVAYEARYHILAEVYQWVANYKTDLIETRIVNNWEEAEEFYQEAYSSGEEGLIIKNYTALWEGKRSKDVVKMKAELVCELEVVDVQEGTGKNTGKIGSLLCKSSGSNCVTVSVGSGLNDADRELDPKEYIGKIISVKYNEVITSKSGDRSLFLPIFQEIRHDKDVADIL